MSGKLDQSLDEILVTQRGANRGRGRARRGGRAAPVGGVKKVVAKAVAKPAAKAAAKSTPAAANTQGATKVIVSNLPLDVTEAQVKEYFTKSAGPIRRVNLTYGPNGQSKGIATILFVKPVSGAKALEANGLKVDNKPMKIEAVFDPSHIPGNEPKSLSDRVTGEKPKVEPRKAKAAKPAEKAAAPAGRGRGRGRATRGRNAGRPKAKTADELDAEMTDYFTATNGGDAAAAPTNGAAPVAAAGGEETAMDEIS